MFYTNDFLCALDADCVLEKNAFYTAMKHFEDSSVSAVGGRLKVRNEKENILVFLQKIEYIKTFNVLRPLFGCLNANFLVSGAYGIFRKQDIEMINGYDSNTVGEDMEITLSIQEKLRETSKKIVYEKESVCYTETPNKIARLFRQRDRWQRGLLDCLIKHRHMLFNSDYGLLGCVAIPCLLFVELFGPVFVILHLINLLFVWMTFEEYFIVKKTIKFMNFKQYWCLYFLYLGFEIFFNMSCGVFRT